MMRLFLIILTCLMPAAAMAAQKAWEGLYQGTIGTAKVTVLLSHEDGIGEDSRYSYTGRPYDLGLILLSDKDELVFTESRKLGAPAQDLQGKGKALITGQWRLKRNATEMTGTWNDPSGKKTLPITLTLMSKPARDKEKFAIGEAYHALWAKDLHFSSVDSQKSFGPLRVAMVKDNVFGLAFPRVQKHPDGEKLDKINAMLEAEHRLAVASARQCQEYRPRQEPDAIKHGKAPSAENEFKVVYANPGLLSITETGSVFCGGAHPSNYTRSMNFDLVEVQRMFGRETDDVSSSPLAEKHLGRIFRLATTKDRENFNSFWWGLWMASAAKAKSDDPDCEAGFMNDRPMAERSADFHFTPKGLAVQRTDYAHAMSVCLFQDYNPLVIPWKELKTWLKEGQAFVGDELK
jgi:hypothetical protein